MGEARAAVKTAKGCPRAMRQANAAKTAYEIGVRLVGSEMCIRDSLWGVSRKSVVGHLTGHTDPADRLAGTLGLAAVAHRMRIDLVRVHDVQAVSYTHLTLPTKRIV